MTEKKVLVLLAAFNGEKYIDDQIKSILLQDQVDIYLNINIDKCSDNTNKICEKYSKINKNVNIINSSISFGSSGKNFNHLIKYSNFSSYDYVALSDQDDIWDSKKIVHATELLQKTNSHGYSSNLIAFWNDEKTYEIVKDHKQKKYDYFFESASAGCTYVLTKELISEYQEMMSKENNMLDKISAHDWAIYSYCRITEKKWYFDTNSLIKYRQHDSNVAGANLGLQAFFKRIVGFFKWYKQDHLTVKKLYRDIKGYDINKNFFFKKPLELRRRNIHSILIYFLLILRIL